MSVALGIASSSPGSRIVLCTDGQANVGLGDVSSARAKNEAKAVSSSSEIQLLISEDLPKIRKNGEGIRNYYQCDIH